MKAVIPLFYSLSLHLSFTTVPMETLSTDEKANIESIEQLWQIPDGFYRESRREVLRRLEDGGFSATTAKKL